jgi:hypothetical protein
MAAQGNGRDEGWLGELANLHLKGMKPELKRTLVLLARGMARKDIANREGVQLPTLKSWISIATSEITSRLEADHVNPAELRGAWVIAHAQCCVAAEWRLGA